MTRIGPEEPLILSAADADTARTLEGFRAEGVIETITDALPALEEELFRIEFPYVVPGTPEYIATFEEFRPVCWDGDAASRAGNWIVLPWRRCAVRLPGPEQYLLLRTARNRFLIEPAEQAVFHVSAVGVAGLSVGLSVVSTLVLSGGPNHLRLADPDELSLSNLNRLLGSVADLERSKVTLAARRVYELNPYAELRRYPEGLTEANMDDFFTRGGRLDLFVEEMDDLRLKIQSRLRARTLGIPVVMATDNGDNVIVDVERFDLEPDRQLFHGRVPERELLAIPATPSFTDRVKIASRIVGSDITPRTQRSLQLVGSKLPTWPQLGNAAALCGPAVSYVARRILTGAPMPSGRYEVSLDGALDPDHATPAAVQERARLTADFDRGHALLFGETT